MSSTSDSTSDHFDAVAAAYARLRTADTFDAQVTERIVELAELRGARVLDIGCGPGTMVRTLRDRYGCDAVGIDRSAQMVEQARGAGGEFHVGVAEALPFDDASFDAVVMRMVSHLLDRPRAFAEARRVASRLAIATTDPDDFEQFWLAPYFPTFAALDRARFPTRATLEQELASFADVRVEPLALPRSFSRADALAKIRGRAYSTFALMSDAEFDAGLAAAEASLPERVEHVSRYLIVVAAR
jgi:ubiquinone/menaquinone biosynthesis C-methylase UbiE